MVQFNLMYQSDDKVGDVKGSYWVDDHKTIVRNYLTHWFTIDFLSIFPFDSAWMASSTPCHPAFIVPSPRNRFPPASDY